MVTSILHRATGVILSIGALLIAWGLTALAAGPQAWANFTACARAPLGFLILFGWTWAFAYHLINGIRHLVQDAGYGYKVQTFVRSGWVSVIGSLVLTALIWIVAMMSRGGA